MKKCILCGENKTTKEHIIPAWLGKLMGEEEIYIGKGSDQGIENIQKRGPVINYQQRTLCKKHNSKLGETLEVTIRALLEPAFVKTIDAQAELAHNISETEAAALTTWIAFLGLKHSLSAKETHPLPEELARAVTDRLNAATCSQAILPLPHTWCAIGTCQTQGQLIGATNTIRTNNGTMTSQNSYAIHVQINNLGIILRYTPENGSNTGQPADPRTWGKLLNPYRQAPINQYESIQLMEKLCYINVFTLKTV